MQKPNGRKMRKPAFHLSLYNTSQMGQYGGTKPERSIVAKWSTLLQKIFSKSQWRCQSQMCKAAKIKLSSYWPGRCRSNIYILSIKGLPKSSWRSKLKVRLLQRAHMQGISAKQIDQLQSVQARCRTMMFHIMEAHRPHFNCCAMI